MRATVARRLAAATAAGCVLAGCSSIGDLLTESDEGGPRTAKIVVMAPAEGTSAEAGTEVLAAVQLALDDAALSIPNWTVEVVAVGNTDARAASEALIENPEVVAVVGGLSGTSVRTIQPILGEASILFVSPADVAPEHTRGADPAAPLRPYVSYFRTAVAAEDVIDTAANYAVDGLDAQKVVIIDGGASDDAARFAAYVRRLGADVVATTPPNADWERIEHVVESADAAKVDVIYTTGDAEFAAQVAKTLAGTGLDATLVGGAALRSEDFVTAAGTAADGVVAVVDPQPVDTSTGAGEDLAARLGEHVVDAPGSYAPAAYDAGTALAAVLRRCLSDEDTAAAAREKCVAEMAQVSFAGVTGEVAFDAFGDRAGTRPQVFQIRDGVWIELGSA
ncbi:MAG TPA: branched-chain amino acid ABC transporter substrate-binding protein [Jiangellaceae bacterium]|nr:branched-chain amino acid ABC transporter substrate-binding protein [Jiangellaceae bacterium]